MSVYLSEEENFEFDEGKPGPSKKVKTGAGTYQTRFSMDWTRTQPFIREVKNNLYKFMCSICNRQVSCGHMGRCDVERHISKLCINQLLNV